jgi:hypothetical protein
VGRGEKVERGIPWGRKSRTLKRARAHTRIHAQPCARYTDRPHRQICVCLALPLSFAHATHSLGPVSVVVTQ